MEIEPGLSSSQEKIREDDEGDDGLRVEAPKKPPREKKKASRVVSRRLKEAAETMKRTALSETIRATLTRGKLKLPTSYNEYKSTPSLDLEMVCARDFSRRQCDVIATAAGIKMHGGKSVQKNFNLSVRTSGYSGTVAKGLPNKERLVRFGADSIQVCSKSEDPSNSTSPEVILTIHYAEVRKVSYGSADSKEFSVHFNSEEGVSGGGTNYKPRSIYFMASSAIEAQSALEAMLGACLNFALYLVEVLDMYKETNKQAAKAGEFHRQIVDLVEIGRGHWHNDSIHAQRLYAEYLESEGSEEEGTFWINRAKEFTRRAERGDIPSEDSSGLSYVRQKSAKRLTRVFEVNKQNRVARRNSRASFSAESAISAGERLSIRLTGLAQGQSQGRRDINRRLGPRVTQISEVSGPGRSVAAGEMKCSLVYHEGAKEGDNGRLASIWSRDIPETAIAYYVVSSEVSVPHYRVEKERKLTDAIHPQEGGKKFFGAVGRFVEDCITEKGKIYVNQDQENPFPLALYGLIDNKMVEAVKPEILVDMGQYTAFAVVPQTFQLYKRHKQLDLRRFKSWGENNGFAARVKS